MEDLILEGTRQKPELNFSASTGNFVVTGQSLPENAIEVFTPILEWIEEYAKSPAPKTFLVFKMRYYNTASSKYFFTIVKKLNNLYKSGFDVEIEWNYQDDDDDMLESGEYFQGLVDIPFIFKVYE